MLTLRYRSASTTIPIELEGLLPERLAGQSLAEIERHELFHGNRRLPLAELFHVAGDPSDMRIAFEGDLSGVHYIGSGMTAGEILVDGPAGRHLGSQMRGGRIAVRGDAGDFAGSEMHGGEIHITGNAGDAVGGAYPGSRRGMTGGAIFIRGAAGHELGNTMRRGLIAVGGDCGELAGINMRAGNLVVFGRAGRRAGAGMRRGTLLLLGPERPSLLPTFRRANRYAPTFFPLLLRELSAYGFAVPEDLAGIKLDLFHGDFLELGRGEIFTRPA